MRSVQLFQSRRLFSSAAAKTMPCATSGLGSPSSPGPAGSIPIPTFSTCAKSGKLTHADASNPLLLPPFQGSVHNYVKAQRDGDTLYIGDHVGQDLNQVTVRGKVGATDGPSLPLKAQSEGETFVSSEQAYDLARNAGLRLLSTLHHYCGGDLSKVEQVIMVRGYVNGLEGFRGHGKVVNGCSDVLVEALGERGRHARTCIGAGSSPAAVTCEMKVRLKTGTSDPSVVTPGKPKNPVDHFLTLSSKERLSDAPSVFEGVFMKNKCWLSVSGITYGAIHPTGAGLGADDLFSFNKTHGTTYLNYIPDGPVRAHFGGITTGDTIVWGAFVEEDSKPKLVGLISAAPSTDYWLETKQTEAGQPWFINEFAVDPSQRGKGIGKMLTTLSVDSELGITELLAHPECRGVTGEAIMCREMYTTFHQENVASRASFLKGGYREVVTYKDSLRERNTTVAKWSLVD